MTEIEIILEHHWDFQDPAKSETLFRELLLTHPEHQAEVLTQIARAQGLQGKFVEAHATLDTFKGLAHDERVQVRYLLERGRLYNSAKQKDEARPLFLGAYTLASRIKADFYTIDAAHMMVFVESPTEQIIWHEKCLALCESTQDEHAKMWLGSVTNNVAWTYHDLGRFEQALETFQKALLWQQANGKAKNIRIAKWSIARTLRSLGKYREAFDLQKNLLDDEKEDGYIYEELGECLLAMEQIDKAKPYFANAHKLLSHDDWFVKNESVRLERLNILAQ
jgi:tetratricopeptide (TPR) repeat protein